MISEADNKTSFTMRIQESSLPKNKTPQWLITFSDLFLILVAFFVLRHQLIETPQKSFLNLQETQNTYTEDESNSIFIDYHTIQHEKLKIPILQDWFSPEGQISLKGDLEIKTIKGMMGSTPSSLNLTIYTHNTETPRAAIELISKLTNLLSEANIELHSINLISSNFKRSDLEIAEFQLQFIS